MHAFVHVSALLSAYMRFKGLLEQCMRSDWTKKTQLTLLLNASNPVHSFVLSLTISSLTSVYFLKVVKQLLQVKVGCEVRYWCISAAATEYSSCKLSNSEEYTALTPAAFPTRLLLSPLMEATLQPQILHTSGIASLRYGYFYMCVRYGSTACMGSRSAATYDAINNEAH